MENRNPPVNGAAIRIERLSVAFAGRQVLRELSLNIPQGGPTFLLGRSGSGKTTLLRAINRLNECLPDCSTQGRVSVRQGEGWLAAYAPETRVEALRRHVGMVFQSPNVLPLSVERNLRLPLEVVCGLSSEAIDARVEAALREVHLWDEVKDRLVAPAATLSGGQQQRLCLARALAMQPGVLLLDEPTSALDFRAAQQIEALIGELAERYPLLVVSHNRGQAQRLAAQAFILHDTERIEAVPAQVLRDRQALLAAMEQLL